MEIASKPLKLVFFKVTHMLKHTHLSSSLKTRNYFFFTVKICGGQTLERLE